MSTTSPEIQALNPAMSIGQIAVDLPGATAVFRRLKLDFCCGGHLSLTSATAEKGLDLQAVLAELAQLQRPSTPTGITEPNPLIDHIVARYHLVL